MQNAARPTMIEIAQIVHVMLARIRTLQTLIYASSDEKHAAPDLPTLRQGLRELECLASELYATVQGASGELVLTEVPSASLSEALAQLVEATAETHALSSRSTFAGQERALSNQQARLLYRLAQEVLAQVAKHEGARRLRLSLDYRSTEICMSIEDDGMPGTTELLFEQMPYEVPSTSPFPIAAQTSDNEALPHTVIHRLREMITSLGGDVRLNSSVEQGTQLQARLPYALPAQEVEQLLPQSNEPAPESPTKISLLIVDNQAVSRAGLHRLLESYPDLEVVGEATDSVQAVSEAAELWPQVVLIDAQLPIEQSLETVRQLRQLNATIHVLFLTDREREELLYEALRAGASGYILKDIAPDELAHAVRVVARGEMFVQPGMATRLLAHLDRHERAVQERLTARERDVLQLLARGLRNKEIAARLTVSERTVNFHLANIYAKLHVSGRTEALSKALERGWLTV